MVRHTPRGRFGRFLIAIVVLAMASAGCDLGLPGSEGEAPIDRESFVHTFTELRVAALQWESSRIPEAEKERILAEHGVTEGDLRGFIETHGRNVPFMNEVWAEVAARVQAEMEVELGNEVPELPGSDTT